MGTAAIEKWFISHPPLPEQTHKYIHIRNEALQDLCPTGEEYRMDLNALRACVLWVNAGIACAQDIELSFY